MYFTKCVKLPICIDVMHLIISFSTLFKNFIETILLKLNLIRYTSFYIRPLLRYIQSIVKRRGSNLINNYNNDNYVEGEFHCRTTDSPQVKLFY